MGEGEPGGEERELDSDTGSTTTITTPGTHKEPKGKVGAARGYLRAGGTTDYLETKGKEKAEGIGSGYKRPVFARYHEEGTDPHRKMPTRNGDFRGDEESDAKAETSNDSRGGTNGISDPKTKTLTGRHAKNSAEEDNSTKTHTGGHTRDRDEGEANSKALTGVHGRDRDEGDANTKTLTGVLKTLTGTLHGEEDNSTKTHTGVHGRERDEGDGNTKKGHLAKENNKALTGVLKTLTGTLRGEEDNSTKTHTGVHARDQDEGDDSTKAPTEVH